MRNNLSKKLKDKNKELLDKRGKVMTDLWRSLNIKKFKNELICNFEKQIDSIDFKHGALVAELELENLKLDQNEMFRMFKPILTDDYVCGNIRDVLYIESFGDFGVKLRKELNGENLRVFIELTLFEYIMKGD